MKQILFILFTLLPVSMMAQVNAGDTVRGKVTDEEGKPLMMANIVEIDKEKRIIGHAVSDVNGNYSLKIVNPKDTLVASYFNHNLETNIIRYGAKRTLITGHSIDIVIEMKRSDEQPKPKQKASSATSDPMGDDWETYVRKNKEYWGVSISFPHYVKIESEENVPLSKRRVFQFASLRQLGGSSPQSSAKKMNSRRSSSFCVFLNKSSCHSFSSLPSGVGFCFSMSAKSTRLNCE